METIILFSCSISTGVYFEKVLKGTDTPLWIRNVQMYLFGILSGLIAVFTKDYSNVMEKGFLFGYNGYICGVIGKKQGKIYAGAKNDLLSNPKESLP